MVHFVSFRGGFGRLVWWRVLVGWDRTYAGDGGDSGHCGILMVGGCLGDDVLAIQQEMVTAERWW
jgi:hypothetical protein